VGAVISPKKRKKRIRGRKRPRKGRANKKKSGKHVGNLKEKRGPFGETTSWGPPTKDLRKKW